MPKRVYTLYRVSTLQQVDPENDIPMQKNGCQDFANSKGWDIVREFTEKGVSGYKVSAKDRDAIKEIQEAALKGSFDILLVYMFDRLGRREDETPFVVEWFVKNGIEVWSVAEGQQTFESHVDKLTNYIRYWQASGESIKTAIRTRDGLSDAVKEGRFRGGHVPYGYTTEKTGIVKKGRELRRLVIEPAEAIAVARMYELADTYGYGARSVTTKITEEGFYDRNGYPFKDNTVRSILKNILYTGVQRSGSTFSEPFDHLVIVDADRWNRVQERRTVRATKHKEMCEAPQKVQDNVLLTGNVYCGHCGGRLIATSGYKSHHSYRTNKERVAIYRCYNHGARAPKKCDGPCTYRAEKVDDIVDGIIHGVFIRTKRSHVDKTVEQRYKKKVRELAAEEKRLEKTLATLQAEMDGLDEMMFPASKGQGDFTVTQLKRRIAKVEANISTTEQRLGTVRELMSNAKQMITQYTEEHKQLVQWAKAYGNATIDARRRIVQQMVEQVVITRDYKIDITMAMCAEQFTNGL